MKTYISTQTTDIEVLLDLNPYFVVIDGVKIGIQEDAGMALQTLRSLVSHLDYFKPDVEKEESWKMEAWSYCDYVEFCIAQINHTTIHIISQMYDESDKVFGTCDAKIFYQKMIETTEKYIIHIENNPDLIKHFYHKIDFKNWKNDIEKLKEFYQKYYA